MTKFIDHTGEKHVGNNGDIFTIIKFVATRNCTVQFQDGTVMENLNYYNLIRGRIKNPNRITLCERGYIGQGEYRYSFNGKTTTNALRWVNIFKGVMMKRHKENIQHI